ncbi:MAG: phosphatidylserine/phosphatidylglycerophosphate/cardiolipin synthase family protein [Solobacterium sp.]|nr:phosphatidylserine/phosphatidylglycerophosphate/cardiolipin synthase family protein [Solobacterium sp.]
MNQKKLCKNQISQEPDHACAFSLLETGRNAFPEIISQIRSARKEILIHMFIWREDRIGLEIAEELLEAADRGVMITIEKDRYGLILEYAEESQCSFCHSPDLLDRIQIHVLGLIYNRNQYRKQLETGRSTLYRKLLEHPNVRMKDSRKTVDHSKYYIFDRQVMILGGINIEDKEYFSDLAGRVYFDYMVKISDPEISSRFLQKRVCPRKKDDLFLINTNEPARSFELKESFLELIDDTESELTILMAYFVPERESISAICHALDRGVHVRILIPRIANFNNDANRLTVSKLLRSRQAKANGKLSVYMTDYMLHAKLIMNEKRIMTGSCNINQKAFNRLGELCIAVNNDDSPFARQVRESADELFRNSAHMDDDSEISCSHMLAFLETTVIR